MSDSPDTSLDGSQAATAGDSTGRCRRILFVCSQGRIRSRTAAELYGRSSDLETRYAGVDPTADRKLCHEDLLWADRIFVFEKRQRNIIQKRYPEVYAAKPIECLYVDDDYDYGDPNLAFILTRKLQRFLGAPEGPNNAPPYPAARELAGEDSTRQ